MFSTGSFVRARAVESHSKGRRFTTSKNDGAPDMMARQIMFFLKFVTLVPGRTGTWYGTQATYYRSKVLSLCTVIIGRDCVVDSMNFDR